MKQILIDCLNKIELNLIQEKINQLDYLIDLTLEKNKVMNLTAINDENTFIDKMIIDCVFLVKFFDLENKSVLDIGTGGGFPGLVLAILCPNTRFTLIDSTSKKIEHVNEVKDKLGLTNVNAFACRAEEFIKQNREKFDIVTARAVKNLQILLELCSSFIKISGHIISYKGSGYKSELIDSQNAINVLNLELIKEVKYQLPLSKEDRYLLEFKKNKSSSSIYPRNYNQILKKPL